MSNYHIEGTSGAGKTTVCEELKKRGYKAIEADEELAFYGNPKTGEPTEEIKPANWIWNKNKIDKKLDNETEEIVFVCGGAMNQAAFKHYFKKTFTLYIDDETLRQRLASRTNNNFGKHPDELALQLEWNKAAIKSSKERETILIDATKSINLVVDEILEHVRNDM